MNRVLRAACCVLAGAVLLSACAATSPQRSLSPAPAEPQWHEVEPDPVVDVDPATGHYIVKPGLLHWATQARDWVERMREWKQRNEIP